ncbi:MAG: response regulator [Polyangiaceae bacterium]
MTEPAAIHVLVIDDSDIAREQMADRLKQAGFTVSMLASPIGATRVIAEQAIDVVVVDVQMPSIRGDRLAALFKGNRRFAALGVILVTGANETELSQLGALAKADAVLSKARLERLPETVNEVYRKYHSGNASPARHART